MTWLVWLEHDRVELEDTKDFLEQMNYIPVIHSGPLGVKIIRESVAPSTRRGPSINLAPQNSRYLYR